jgi:tRNA(Ile)-lysidine synthase
MALLAALCIVVPVERLFCLHVEHGLRAEESKGDAEFVRDFCEKNKVNCRIMSIPPGKVTTLAKRRGIGLEAAARFYRHRALFREAARLDCQGEKTRILIGHTKDDMLELALMRILRGAGPAGLAIMPQNRGRILRPLLSLSRGDIIAYLKEKKLPWREDSTNTGDIFLRNRIRHRLIPLLSEFFPAWKKGITGMAETQSLASAFIAEEAAQRIAWKREKRTLVTDAGIFFAQSEIVREEALFQGINLFLKGEQGTGNWEQGLGSREKGAGSRYCCSLSEHDENQLLSNNNP